MSSSLGNTVQAASKLACGKYRGVEGVLSPTNTHMVGNGPFAMNTEEEIQQAIEDYNAGKFGFLKD